MKNDDFLVLSKFYLHIIKEVIIYIHIIQISMMIYFY